MDADTTDGKVGPIGIAAVVVAPAQIRAEDQSAGGPESSDKGVCAVNRCVAHAASATAIVGLHGASRRKLLRSRIPCDVDRSISPKSDSCESSTELPLYCRDPIPLRTVFSTITRGLATSPSSTNPAILKPAGVNV